MNCLRYIFKNLGPFIFLLLGGFVSQAFGATYYIAPTGGSDSNSGLSRSQPWATFTYANSPSSPLKAGDTLIVMDGTYNQKITWTKSGTNTEPITIQAENDGGATVNGGSSTSLDTAASDVSFVGLVFRNTVDLANNSVFLSNCTRITLKRVSIYSYQAPNDGAEPAVSGCSGVLFEDVAIMAKSRKAFVNLSASGSNTFRRVWFRLLKPSGIVTELANSGYNSSNVIWENNIGTVDASVTSIGGFEVWNNSGSSVSNNNKHYGNITINMPGANGSFWVGSVTGVIHDNLFDNNVVIGSDSAFTQRADNNLIVNHFTAVSVGTLCLTQNGDSVSFFDILATVKNSVFMNCDLGFNKGNVQPGYSIGMTHTYNAFWDVATLYSGYSPGTGEIQVNPNFNTATYGKGAYLIRPAALKGKGENGSDIGAEVLYRYQNGVLTNVPLWPWPMEDRIFKETGISVTWESNGGLWKTLNGVYDGVPPPPVIAKPAPPSGLKIK